MVLAHQGHIIVAGDHALFWLPVASNGGGGEVVPGPGSPDTLSVVNFHSANPTLSPHIIQRQAGSESVDGGYADVQILLEFTGDMPENAEVRVFKSSGGATVKDWTFVPLTLLTAGLAVGTLRVTTGQWYLHEARDGNQPANAATKSTGTMKWGVGALVLPHGQSNMIFGTLGAGAFNDPLPAPFPATNEHDYYYGGNVGASLFGTSGWFPPNNGTPSGGSQAPALAGGTYYLLRVLSKALEVKHGKKIPVGLVPWAFDGQALKTLSPSGSLGTTLFNGSGTTAGSIGMKSPKNFFCGDFEVVEPNQGEANAGQARPVRFGELKDYCGELFAQVAPYGRSPAQLAIIPAMHGSYTSVDMDNARMALLDLDAHARAVGWDKVRAGWNNIDMDAADGGDGLHYAETGTTGKKYRKLSVRRAAQAALWAMGCSPTPARGPQIVSHVRNGLVVTFTVEHERGTALAAGPGAITGCTATEVGSGIVRNPVIAIAGADTFTATFPAGTVFPVNFRNCGGKTPNVSNRLGDNAEYPFVDDGTGANYFKGSDVAVGLPLMPTDVILIA